MINPVHKSVLVVLGPTGSGKTDLSFLISKKIPLEVISADSRQIYKYMDIGTAKTSPEILSSLPHHFVGTLEPDQNYSAGQFGRDARKAVDEIFTRERIPLVVGGSGLYLRAFLEGFFEGNVRDWNIRESLIERLDRHGPAQLHEELLKVDKLSAENIHPHNGKRIIRALELFMITGESFANLRKRKMPPLKYPVLKIGLAMERPELYRRINQRVDQMFESGLITEVKQILKRGFDKNLNSLNTVGYKEVIQFLEGKIDYKTCVNLVKRNSRRYAKRQMTWFRSEKYVHWFKIEQADDLPVVAREIIKEYISYSA
jgi:tRNA dimethylallyltransferase